MSDDLSLGQTLLIANAAINHAKQIITRGDSWFSFNALPEIDRHLWRKTISALRDYEKQYFALIIKDYPLTNPNLLAYIATVQAYTTFAAGNCHELSYAVIDYLLHHNPTVHAEIYCMNPGDHTFVVINRKPNSIDNDPMTWGEHAVICDPWIAGAFPATEHLQRLNYHYRDIHGNNHAARYEPNKHQIAPLKKYLNTTCLREYIDTEQERLLIITLSDELARMMFEYATHIKNLISTPNLNHVRTSKNADYALITAKYNLVARTLDHLNHLIDPVLSLDQANYTCSSIQINHLTNAIIETMKEMLCMLRFDQPYLNTLRLFSDIATDPLKDQVNMLHFAEYTESFFINVYNTISAIIEDFHLSVESNSELAILLENSHKINAMICRIEKKLDALENHIEWDSSNQQDEALTTDIAQFRICLGSVKVALLNTIIEHGDDFYLPDINTCTDSLNQQLKYLLSAANTFEQNMLPLMNATIAKKASPAFFSATPNQRYQAVLTDINSLSAMIFAINPPLKTSPTSRQY